MPLGSSQAMQQVDGQYSRSDFSPLGHSSCASKHDPGSRPSIQSLNSLVSGKNSAASHQIILPSSPPRLQRYLSMPADLSHLASPPLSLLTSPTSGACKLFLDKANGIGLFTPYYWRVRAHLREGNKPGSEDELVHDHISSHFDIAFTCSPWLMVSSPK